MKLTVSSRGVSPVDGTEREIRGMRTRVNMKYHEIL
jgi:hypothetical protein